MKSLRLFQGPEGEGSDSGAILGPLIQLIAPLIGPLSGPLIGPLSRTSSGVRILFCKIEKYKYMKKVAFTIHKYICKQRVTNLIFSPEVKRDRHL